MQNGIGVNCSDVTFDWLVAAGKLFESKWDGFHSGNAFEYAMFELVFSQPQSANIKVFGCL